MTRPQLFLLVTVPLVLLRIAYQVRSGAYRDAFAAPTPREQVRA
jgi:hypothetical protein